MQLLQKYFLSQALSPLILSLAALTSLALLTQSLQTLDLIVENRQGVETFFRITALALPQLIAIILPLSTFLAVLYAFNRLSVDSEFIVAKASGITPWQIAAPIMRLGTYALIIHLIISLFVQPLAFRELRSELFKVRTDMAARMVQAGQFVTPVPNLTLYAREIGNDGSLMDILIYDTRDKALKVTHTAKYGFIKNQNNSVNLTLRDGYVQQRHTNGDIDVVKFNNYQIDMSNIVVVDNVLRLKSSDRYLHELLRPNPREYLPRKLKRELKAEGHSRIAAPFYNLALPLLALCFMVRGQHLRLGYGRRIAICAVLGFSIRLAGFALTSSAEASSMMNIGQYALPFGVIIFALLYLTWPQIQARKNRLFTSKTSNYQPLAT